MERVWLPEDLRVLISARAAKLQGVRLGQLGPRHPDLQRVWWVLTQGIRCVAERLTLPRHA